MVHCLNPSSLPVLLACLAIAEAFVFMERWKSMVPHHRVERQRDLLIDLEVPSLGVLMRQRIQKRIADAPAVEAANTLDGTPVAREQQGASGAGNLAPSVPVERAWKHSGYFGQDMSTKTRVFTFPIVRTQKHLTEDQESRPTRQWKNLMEPRKPEDAAVTSRQKLKRRAVNQLPEVAPAYLGGGVASDLYPPKNLSPTVPPPRCHCRESPANRSLEDLLELVPSISRTIHKSANGSIIKEIIRASLSKSLELERVYGQRDCHCNCQVSSAHFVKGAAGVTVRPQHKILTWNPARGRRTSSSPGVEATQANRSPPSYRGMNRSVKYPTPTTKTGCPRRVFVKYPGEPLPPAAKDCRKLWLPEHTFRKQTFWECVDTQSSECNISTKATSPFLGLDAGVSTRPTGDVGGARASVASTSFMLPTTVASSTRRRTDTTPSAAPPTTIASSARRKSASSTPVTLPTTTTWTMTVSSNLVTLPPKTTSSTTRTTASATSITPPASTSATLPSISSRPKTTFKEQETTIKRTQKRMKSTSTISSTAMHSVFTMAFTPEKKLFPFYKIKSSPCPKFLKSTTSKDAKLKHRHHYRSPTSRASFTTAINTTRDPIAASNDSAAFPNPTSTSTFSTICVNLSAEQISRMRKVNHTLADTLASMCVPTPVICAYPGQKNCVLPDAMRVQIHVSHYHRSTHHGFLLGDKEDGVQRRTDGTFLSTRGAHVVHQHPQARNATGFPYPYHEAPGDTSEATGNSSEIEPFTRQESRTPRASHGIQASTAQSAVRTTYPEKTSGQKVVLTEGKWLHGAGSSRAPNNKELGKRSHASVALQQLEQEGHERKAVPIKVNVVKSRISVNAVLDVNQCREPRCPRKGTTKPRRHTVVVRTVPIGDDDYEYYYVYDDEKSSGSQTETTASQK
ncbi:unnamed protein product [Ixodes persulcatus]